MANKPLKSVKFPGLPDTYTVPQFDSATGGMGTQGTIPDSKAVKDSIDGLNENLNGESVELTGGLLINGYYAKNNGAVTSSANFDLYKYDISDADTIVASTYGYYSTIAVASNSDYDATSIIGKTFSSNTDLFIGPDSGSTISNWVEKASVSDYNYLYVSCYKQNSPVVTGYEGGLDTQTLKNTNDITKLNTEALSDFRSYVGLLDTANKWSVFSSDANNLTPNRIYAISYYTNISNLPYSTFIGFITTYMPYYGASNLAMQIAVRGNAKETYTRVKWAGIWTAWIKLMIPDDIDMTKLLMAGGANPSLSVLGDCNNALVNTWYSLSINDDIAQVDNLPIKQGGTLFTYAATGNQNANIKVQLYITSSGVLYIRNYWSEWKPWKKCLQNSDIYDINPVLPSVALFEKIGVIGDSYASGEVYITGGPVNHYGYSWGQIMARKNGVECINFSRGGLTTKTWLSDATKGLSFLLSSDPQNLYIIALGLNDNTEIYNERYSLGTDADFDLSDYENTPDTFYGNMCKIIGNIQTKAPNAKIILSTMAINYSATNQAVNGAIEDCAELASIPVIKQYEDGFFTSTYYINGKVGGHPTAPVYSGMAVAIERMIGQSMIDNYSYFYDYDDATT